MNSDFLVLTADLAHSSPPAASMSCVASLLTNTVAGNRRPPRKRGDFAVVVSHPVSVDELVQFRSWLQQLTMIWQRLFHLSQTGHVEAWILEATESSQRDVAAAPGFRLWAEARGHWLTKDFRAFLESEMTRAPELRAGGSEENE